MHHPGPRHSHREAGRRRPRSRLGHRRSLRPDLAAVRPRSSCCSRRASHTAPAVAHHRHTEAAVHTARVIRCRRAVGRRAPVSRYAEAAVVRTVVAVRTVQETRCRMEAVARTAAQNGRLRRALQRLGRREVGRRGPVHGERVSNDSYRTC